MKTVSRIALALWLGLAASVAAAPVSEEAPRAGFRAPRFTVQALEGGEPLNLTAFEGKVVLLNFWATWCAPCKEELPSLVKLQSAFPVTDFTVVALSQDADTKDVTKFLKKHPINFPNGLDSDGEIARAYQVRGLPATYLIDARGVVVERIFGPRDYGSKEWREKVAALIQKGRESAPAKP